ncbi:hypothetical protein Dimus_001119, partial [Dionaea muscipula]
MARELGLRASSEYFVRVGKNYSQISSDEYFVRVGKNYSHSLDVDAMNFYIHVDENRIVHVYAKNAVDVQHSGPSTSHGVLRRCPRKIIWTE